MKKTASEHTFDFPEYATKTDCLNIIRHELEGEIYFTPPSEEKARTYFQVVYGDKYDDIVAEYGDLKCESIRCCRLKYPIVDSTFSVFICKYYIKPNDKVYSYKIKD